MFVPQVRALLLVRNECAAHPEHSSQQCVQPMQAKKNPSSAAPHRDESVGDIWFETKWGMTMFVLAACLAGSGLLWYLAIYMAWL